jgi:hypothetical protein
MSTGNPTITPRTGEAPTSDGTISKISMTHRASSERDRRCGGHQASAPDHSRARTRMLAVLSSWSGLVADERGVPGPGRREVVVLARFLRAHLDWLATHPALPTTSPSSNRRKDG